MIKIFPLDRWQGQDLALREDFSDEEESEEESSSDEFIVPQKKFKKRSVGPPKLETSKHFPGKRTKPPGPPTGPPPKRKRIVGPQPSNIPTKPL